jgi:hypothetical protein
MTDLETYRSRLLLALRLRDVPGPRIAEALAEVDSHVAETGEDPAEAFGSPKAYALRLSRALDPDAPTGVRRLVRGLGWTHLLLAVLSSAGTWLLSDGLFALGAGRPASAGLSSTAAVLLGLALLGATGALIARATRSEADPVRDPRTGADLAPPAPRWALAVLVAAPVVAFAGAYLAGTGVA